MAKFDYPYRKSVNITAWVAQFVVCIILIISSALVLKMVGAMDNNDDGQYNEETEYENAMSEYSGLLTHVAFANFQYQSWEYNDQMTNTKFKYAVPPLVSKSPSPASPSF